MYMHLDMSLRRTIDVISTIDITQDNTSLDSWCDIVQIHQRISSDIGRNG